jgi:hypothetical protein
MSVLDGLVQEQERIAFKNRWVNDFQVSPEVAEALEIIIDTQCIPLGYTSPEELRQLLAVEVRDCQARDQKPSQMLRHLFQIVYIRSIGNPKVVREL